MAREQPGDINAIEVPWVCPIVCGGPANQDLDEEQQGHDDKVFDGGLLAGGGGSRQHVRMDMLTFPLPTQEAKLAKGE
jgi:hypothetical protein